MEKYLFSINTGKFYVIYYYFSKKILSLWKIWLDY